MRMRKELFRVFIFKEILIIQMDLIIVVVVVIVVIFVVILYDDVSDDVYVCVNIMI